MLLLRLCHGPELGSQDGWWLQWMTESCSPWSLCSPVNYVQFLYVFLSCILQCLCCNFTWVRTAETFLSSLGTYLRWEASILSTCVCMYAHALVLFKTVSLCLLQPWNPKSHLNGKRVCVCNHVAYTCWREASGEATCSGVDRPVLCTLTGKTPSAELS